MVMEVNMGDFSVTSTSKGSKASLKGGHSKSLDDSLKGTDGFKKGGSCMKKGGKARSEEHTSELQSH